jgi:hypothetical protein
MCYGGTIPNRQISRLNGQKYRSRRGSVGPARERRDDSGCRCRRRGSLEAAAGSGLDGSLPTGSPGCIAGRAYPRGGMAIHRAMPPARHKGRSLRDDGACQDEDADQPSGHMFLRGGSVLDTPIPVRLLPAAVERKGLAPNSRFAS